MIDFSLMIDYLRGRSSRGYELFGAHFVWENNQSQVRFAVYAPQAKVVSLIGDFNAWNPWPMQRLDCGVWVLTSPDPQPGDRYKYRITTAEGEIWDRADPFAFFTELRPNTASVIQRLDGYHWQDGAFLSTRQKNFNRPLNIYELHAGSWRMKDGDGSERFLQYDELADQLIPYIRQMGYTHIELLPLTEYPLDASWGYQVSGYFSATSRYGSPHQLMALIDRCHQAGIGVILDFVPTHFVPDYYALARFDGSCLYEPDNPNLRDSPWGTVLFDFTKPHVLSFLRSALDFWITVYHFDGIRYDAVSNLIYQGGSKDKGLNEPGLWFLRSTNFTLQQDHPEVMLIAEDSSDYLKVTAPVAYGGLGFDYKWNLGWMHDTLDYLATPFAERAGMKNRFLFSMSYFYQENYILPLSHDEVVHGKKTIIDKLWGSYEQKFAQLRCLSCYMLFHPGKKLSFMGNELAEFMEWSEERQPGWNLLDYPVHRSFHVFLQRLNTLYCTCPALWEQDFDSSYFQWLDMGSVFPEIFAIQRRDGSGQELVLLLNLSDRDCPNYPLSAHLPATPSAYRLLLDSQSKQEVDKEPLSSDSISLPGLSCLILQRENS